MHHSVALGCSGPAGGLVIEIDVSHHFMSPSNGRKATFIILLNSGCTLITSSEAQPAYIAIWHLFRALQINAQVLIIDRVHSFSSCTTSYKHETAAGSFIDLSEM